MANKDVYNINKLFHYKDKLKDIANQEIVAPVNLQVDLTNRCNNKCSWCFYDIYPLPEFSRRDSLATPVALCLPEEFKAVGGKSIEWTGGGEPTIYPEFNAVVSRARKVGLHQAMVTNGKLLDEAVADECLDFDWVRVSLNSASASVYKQQHGNDSFFRVIRNIEEFARIKNSSCVLGVSMIVDKYNYGEIAVMVAMAKSLGADNARISLPQTPADDKMFEGIWDRVLGQMKMAKEFESGDFAVFTNENRIETLRHDTHSGRCYYHHITPSLGANGVIYPCCHFKYLPQYNLGNLYSDTFRGVWEGEKRRLFTETVGEKCDTSCWMNSKNILADYIIKDLEDVPHLEYP